VSEPRKKRPLLVPIGAGLVVGAIAIVLVGREVAAPVVSPHDAAAASGDPGSARDAPRLGQPGDGTERLPGSIVDVGGLPVADVMITAELELGPGDQSRAPASRARPVIAYADAGGAFVLEGLEPGRHRLRVEGADIFTAEVRFVAVPSDGIRIAVARRVELSGAVMDAGRAVAGATVTIESDAIGGRLIQQSDADGVFAFDLLPEGSYLVWAHHGDLAARSITAPRLGAGPFAPLVLTLEPATIVVGRVVDRATGLGVAAAVALEPAGGGTDAARFGRSDDTGAFRIEGVPHGRWTLDAWAPGWLSAGALELEAGRGVPEVELVGGGIVEGRVLDGQGRPVEGARVTGTGVVALGRGVEASADVDADRLRRFSGFAPAPAAAAPAAAGPPGDFTSDPRFVPRGELGVLLGPLPFPPAVPGAAVVPSTIVGAAATGNAASGRPATAWSIEPEPLAPEPAYEPTWVTGADGRFRLTGLEAATWTLVAIAPGLAEGRSAPVPLTLGQIVTGLEITMTPGTFLVGRVTSTRGPPIIGATITVTPKGARGDLGRVLAVTDLDGRYKLGPVVGAVTVTVTAWGHADVTAELDVPPPAGDFPDERVHDAALAPADATLRGRVLDGDRLPVRGAEVEIEAGGARGRRGATDDTGWFEIASVPAGDARVRVDHAEYPPQSFPITTSDDAAITLAWGGTIEAQVIDHHTGEPMPGVTVAVVGPTGRIEVPTGDDGDLHAGPLLAGRYTLEVAVPGYLPVEHVAEVAAGTTVGAVTVRDVRLALERGALLAGVVRDKNGARISGATVVVTRAGGATAEGKTDSDGEFRLRDVPTGDVTVKITKGALAATQSLRLAPGDELLSFTAAVE